MIGGREEAGVVLASVGFEYPAVESEALSAAAGRPDSHRLPTHTATISISRSAAAALSDQCEADLQAARRRTQQ